MDWSAFSALTPDDLNAMVAYLRTIPPVSNKVPPIDAAVSAALSLGQVQDADPAGRSADHHSSRQRRHERRRAMKRFLKWAARHRARPRWSRASGVPVFHSAVLHHGRPRRSRRRRTTRRRRSPASRIRRSARSPSAAATSSSPPAASAVTRCHGPQGPQFDKYLGGGIKFQTRDGTYVSRNLTPDKETGLARRTDDEVKRVIRSGVFPDGHVAPYRLMPWGAYTQLDRRRSARGRRLPAPSAGRAPSGAGTGGAVDVSRSGGARGGVRGKGLRRRQVTRTYNRS